MVAPVGIGRTVEQVAEKNVGRRLGLNAGDIRGAVHAYFGPNASFERLAQEKVGGGLMAPKAPIRLTGGESGTYLVRELPFYVQNPRAYGEFATRFQSWLSERGLTPELASVRGSSGGNFLHPVGSDGSRFVYMQRFFDGAATLAGSDRAQARLFGNTLRRFHQQTSEYPGLKGGKIPDGVVTDSGKIQDDLFTFIVDRFAETTANPKQRKAFAELVAQAKAHRAELPIDERRFPTVKPTLLHGDFNPGNVLLAGDRPQVIDFDNLRVGHPASDVAHALCSTMVFRFFDKSLVTRSLPSQLSAVSKRAGLDLLKGYLSAGHTPAQIDEIFKRLKIEVPLAIEKDVMFGFVDGHFPASQLPQAWQRVASLEKDFNAWLDEARRSVTSNQRPAPSPLASAAKPGALAPPGVLDGWRPGNAILTPEYWVEHLDPEHLRWDRHQPLLEQWRATEPGRDYFEWLADHRAHGGRRADDIHTAYLAGTDAGKEAAARFEVTKDGRTRLSPLGNADAAWVEKVEQSTEPVTMLYVADPMFNFAVDLKGPTVNGNIYHSSHRSGRPSPVAGFMPVNPDRTVDRFWSESGHYKDKPVGIYDFLMDLAKRGAINPEKLRAQAYRGEEMRADEMLKAGRPDPEPITLLPPGEWLNGTR